MILVFSALLEYAFVNSLTRMELERRKKKQRLLAARAVQVFTSTLIEFRTEEGGRIFAFGDSECV